MREELLSVGIDIGTSTTQLVFSKLMIENIASNFSVPKVVIVDKEIIYRSEIYFTPLRSPTEIDGTKVKEIIEGEYKKAGIEKTGINTGAVIITGETARKENAKEVLETLSGFAGDFVVATAGPDLESIIAGKGAGAHVYSKEGHTGVVNIDIGGGTSNLALFDHGEVKDTGCLDVGGRLVKIDKNSGEITYLSEKMKELIERKNLPLRVGTIATKENLQPILDAMVYALMQSVGIRPMNDEFSLFITHKEGEEVTKFTCDETIKNGCPITSITFSGGVADYIYGEDRAADEFEYGDIGILLGQAIKTSPLCKELKVLKSVETIRATVVGAGTQTMEVSGSTITYTKDAFPIKNLPILKLSKEEEESAKSMEQAISTKLNWFKLEGNLQKVAIAFEGSKTPSFVQVSEYAKGLLAGMKELMEQELPFIILVENDMAKVLGQSMYRMLEYKKDVVCLDSIHVEDGDYVDIGKPVAEGTVLPVVVKTLVFNK
ncbi:MAG: ethanolamine ammonia-lyase reactivating factor EutA [Anaerocolumna aminovalerica]|uniref:ethanolamine ammonia-lyase reactivating factor EutA n=1 Tax=Anaerocolumna aminovalerica TaxID=1527 RepID=UPI002912EA43|nr:ethanolamine ammonia-lyase reactivating factor EutA [Anaerocolumna aminovalerica]MDU6265458.1 ethanolamine ammonia-lyase reactivating factor EutA [Anaerocolumna aminovalerica]